MNNIFSSDIIQITFAYIDPGSGSVLISLIVAAFAIAFYYLRSFFYEKVHFIFKKKDPLHKNKYSLIFYSKASHYWNIFMPIIRELNKRKIPVTYFTSDRKDPGLRADYANMKPAYIGEGHEAYFILNRLQADMIVMTTPGLDVLQIKRSKTVKHYSFISHSVEGVATARPYSLDYFDSVMAIGEHQLETIRQIERIRNLPTKKIKVIGSTYLDVMQEELDQKRTGLLKLNTNKKTIMLAPSWGEKSFLNKFGDKLINELLKTDYQIILRPHPQSWESEIELLENLKSITFNKDSFIWDDNPSALESMISSDIMVSDFSGIVFDYIFLFARPVIIAEFEIDPRKYEMNILPSKNSTLMKLIREDKIGYQLKESEIVNITNILEQAINYNLYSKHIQEFRNRIYCYPREAGKRGADFIEEVLDNLAHD